MPKFGYLVVEGPHDVEFVCRLLKPFQFSRIQHEDELDSFFKPLIPKDYPPNGDLLKRMPIPQFVKNSTHLLAIHSAIGDSRLVQTVEENAALIDIQQVTGMGIILDSDNEIAPEQRYKKIKELLQAKQLNLSDNPGEVISGTPRLGAFVLPDNQNQGTLEDLLIECGQSSYPKLLESATTHIDTALKNEELTKSDLKEIRKPAGKNKAILGTMASVLRPGKSIQVSIQDNRWLSEDNIEMANVKAVQNFLKELFEIET